MPLAKLIGRAGFTFGLVGSWLFYSSPPSSILYESHGVCPSCPYVDIPFASGLTRIQVGLSFGLLSGLVYAVVGFAMGSSISKVRLWASKPHSALYRYIKQAPPVFR